MNTELAQLAALTAHGTAALFAPERAVELAGSHSTFRFVHAVSFDWNAGSTTSDCISWWDALKRRGVTRLHLTRGQRPPRQAHVQEHYASAFAGGLTLELVAGRSHSHELWRGHWEVTAPRDPGQRIWSVRYQGREAPDTFAELRGSLEQMRLDFRESLEEILGYARLQGFAEWERWFAEALELLDSPAPVPPYHADILPEFGYPLPARQLMAAAIRGWVFGGMGSWNDLSPPDTAEYERVTAMFFDATIGAVGVAAGAFDSHSA